MCPPHAESQTSYDVDPNPFPEDEGDRLDMGIQFAKANDEATARDNTKETQTSYDVDPSPFPENEGDSLSMGIDFAKANDQARARDNTKDTQTDAPTYQDGGTQTDRPRVSNHRTQTQRPTIVSQGTQYEMGPNTGPSPPPEPRRDVVMAPASILGKRRKEQTGGKTGTANPVGYIAPDVQMPPASILGKRRTEILQPYGKTGTAPPIGSPRRYNVRAGGRVRSEVERLNEYTRTSNNMGKKGVVAKNKGGK